ncbi:hypothetical protein C8J98_102250 [Luteibacter sp. OK325]|jgi:hypothetical protein|uniref:hypothetical protein n=1 Tax=Luteibacter sp. OK325 TaxID=2135670 RepID=UPI000D3C7166|nr:hypothetical protein [Luteibacter sp. OK325]PTR34062.1 hypothetical protein C8J98_102250 [Luteibacter sp. OK325]
MDSAEKGELVTELRSTVERWGISRCVEIPVAGLLARCPVAYKWKAPFRSTVLREAFLWRMHDLGVQMLALVEAGHILGPRILLRSAVETLAMLSYLNQQTAAVVEGRISMTEFGFLTGQLLLGSRNKTTEQESVNVLTVLKHADRRWPKLKGLHEDLSESAHPNYTGVLYGYSTTEPERYETHFENHWLHRFGDQQVTAMAWVFGMFEEEYDQTWLANIVELEQWLRDNDAELQREADADD